MRKWLLLSLVFALLSSSLTACGAGSTGETAFTAAQGPADSALPYQAVFAVNKNSDEQLVAAAQNFCSRTVEFSRGSAVFNLVLSDNALQDLKTGKADVILLENPEITALAPISEAFRYKSYEHFAMTANSDATLRILSDILDADVFAGFYAGSNVFLSRGTLDSKFRPLPRKDAEESHEPRTIPVASLSDSTARAFSLLNAEVTVTKELDARIRACSLPDSIVEFSFAELDSPALIEVILDDIGESDHAESVYVEPEPFVATQAFIEIKPVWLIFADSGYEKLSQTNRAAAAEAAAYMVSDIDGVYLEYEQKMLELLAAKDVPVSRDFTATRTQVLRLADEQNANLTGIERKLRDAVEKIQ